MRRRRAATEALLAVSLSADGAACAEDVEELLAPPARESDRVARLLLVSGSEEVAWGEELSEVLSLTTSCELKVADVGDDEVEDADEVVEVEEEAAAEELFVLVASLE